MKVSTMRKKLLDEIAKIPDEKVPDILQFLHYSRLGLGAKASSPQKILQLAGSWKDMSDGDFKDFLNDVTTRRKKAFMSRRNRETSVD
ncbi:MAG: hypothetical protein GXO74_05320 [Calditrichaeota bacterium]|nr:hypothetical protein [Calditrichota bacterium]